VQSLNASTSTSQKASVYAQAGIWYDAIATLLDTPANSPDRTAAAEFLQVLLSQVGIKEASGIKTAISKHATGALYSTQLNFWIFVLVKTITATSKVGEV
ncbi:MAG: DUF928 domain-containing protein, partial [Pseudanabaena sp. SU_2_4]|nr:DUF928 domain-containing protein [Pseudanabaena sp. SU_2_4]